MKNEPAIESALAISRNGSVVIDRKNCTVDGFFRAVLPAVIRLIHRFDRSLQDSYERIAGC